MPVAATASSVPSVEALSTTTIPSSACVWAASARRHWASMSLRLYVATTAMTRIPLRLSSRRVAVCALVLTFNRKALLVECLRSLLAQTAPVDEVLVVDNASTDGTEKLLRAEGLLDRVRWLPLERNLGSSGGFNRGVAAAREGGWDWIWIMD